MKKILTCAIISLALLTGCTTTKTGIIKVNDKVITQAQFDKALDEEIDNSILKNFGGSANFVKSEDNIMYKIFREKIVKSLIIKTLIDNEIENRGIKVTKEDFKAEMKTVIDKVGSKEELNKILKQRGISNSAFTEDLKTQIKTRKLIESISNIKISDNEAENYYKTNIEKFKHPEQVRASHILISADTLQLIKEIKAKNKDISNEDLNTKVDEILAERKSIAENILKEVKNNPDSFEKIASEKSDDKLSGERGGELGFFSKTDMVPEFANAAFSMKPNTISDSLIKTNYGYHIIKVTDRMEAGTTPFVKVKDNVKYYLEVQEQLKVLKNLTDGLMKTAKIEYLDDSFNPDKKDNNTKTEEK